ncbi:MAG: hypothetical protein FWF56_06820 [Firmicutes bacterium]|nr:hypothetical protein [Bacillota bacterium]MCL1953964.1 hypothetical protein [Bacillota bacterium]
MIFDKKILSLGAGRVSNAYRYGDVVVVFVNTGQSIVQRQIENGVVKTVLPKLFSYADDCLFVGERLLERHGG